MLVGSLGVTSPESGKTGAVFEFTGSLADWLGIFVSLATLVAGSGTGVYLAGVRRTRLDDRRKLLLELMTWLKGTFPVDLELADPDATKSRLMSTSIERIDEVNRTVRLLPWKDRALWHRVVAVAVASGPPDQLFRIAAGQFTAGPDLTKLKERRERRPRPTTRDAENLAVVPVSVQFLGWSFDFASQGGPEEVLGFEAHLVRKVNPTLFSRWRSFLQTPNCLWRGPRPWSASIRPTDMEFYRQIRHVTRAAEIAWDDQRTSDGSEPDRTPSVARST